MPKYIDADRFKQFLEGEEDGVWCDEICDDCLYEVEYRIDHFPAADVEPKPITGETSDGYHTFNELYHHRAVLFSVIVRNYPDRAWKARQHHDGSMFDGMFIVGIETPDGQATYHYDVDPYWDMFDCRELERAPEWDGHTPAEAIERIGSLSAADVEPKRKTGVWIRCGEPDSDRNIRFECSVCHAGDVHAEGMNVPYCWKCGSEMKGEKRGEEE